MVKLVDAQAWGVCGQSVHSGSSPDNGSLDCFWFLFFFTSFLFGSFLLCKKVKKKKKIDIKNRKNKKKINQETKEIKKQEQKKISLLSSVG